MAYTFDWIEINAGDMDRLSTFYTNVFGWEIIAQEKVQGFPCNIFKTGGIPRPENMSRFGIWSNSGKGVNGILVYIWVEDIQITLQKIVANGGKIIQEKDNFGPGFRAIFADPENNCLALFEDK